MFVIGTNFRFSFSMFSRANLGLIKRDKCQSGLNVRSKIFVILADFASYGCNVVVDSGKDTG